MDFSNILKQETQLSVRNCATCFESVKVTKHGTIQYVRYRFLLVCYSNLVPKTNCFSDIRIQKCRDREDRVKGP